MGLSGRKINDKMVLFGDPLNDKALEALRRSSPTGNDIIKSLPKSAFIPIHKKENKEELLNAQKKEQENILILESIKKAKERRRLKREKSFLKKQVEINNEKSFTFLTEIIFKKNPIEKIKEFNMSLEEELAMLEKEIEKKNVQSENPEAVFSDEPAPQQMEMKDQVLQILKNLENAPSEEVINSWKEKYGKSGVHVMAFGEDDVYIYHHLTRGEWRKIKEIMNKLKENNNDADEIEEKLKEKVVLYCVLFPKVGEQWLDNCKAGVLDSLYQMILLNSGFLTAQQAMLLTTQL
jgi:hypothetical protein